jgi:hypothetical protein
MPFEQAFFGYAIRAWPMLVDWEKDELNLHAWQIYGVDSIKIDSGLFMHPCND